MDKNEPQIEGDWRTETNKVIVENLLDNISKLLDAEVKHSTCCDRDHTYKRIVIEYAKEKKQ